MIEEKDLITGGKFLKPHGLKGELNAIVEGYDAEILEMDYPMIVNIDGIYVPFYAESVRPKGQFSSLVKIDGVDTVEEARRFVNKNFFFKRNDVADFLEIDPSEIHAEGDFVGFKVFDKAHGYLGRVEEVDDSTENVLLLVRPEEREDTLSESKDQEEQDIIYIPFNEDLIVDFIENPDNPGDSEIHFDLPEGII